MKRKRHGPDQIIAKLREADAMLGTGASIAQVCRRLEVSEQTFHRWRNQYGGMKANEAKRLKELEQENTRLKKLVANLSLDNAILKEFTEGNGEPGAPQGGGEADADDPSGVGASGVQDDRSAAEHAAL